MGSIRTEEDSVTVGPVRVGVSIPPTGFKSREEADAYVNAAAAGGLDHMITADHVAFQGGQGRDGLMTMAWLAGLHPTIGLYVGVYLLALRHPVAVARQVSTLAEDAPGRLTLGIGVGGEDRHEMESVGVDPATRDVGPTRPLTSSSHFWTELPSTTTASSTRCPTPRSGPNLTLRLWSRLVAVRRPPFKGPEHAARAGWPHGARLTGSLPGSPWPKKPLCRLVGPT